MTLCQRYALPAAAALAVSLAGYSPTHAAPLFSDNFDGDSATSVLNFNAFSNWTVVNHPTETVDYIRSGGFGIGCAGGVGGCVDLDGSTGNAGRLLSNTLFTILPGVVYTLTVDVSGNQRNGRDDTFMFGLDGLASGSFGVAAGAAYTTYTLIFSPSSAATARLFVVDANTGGDNIGPILDNVTFSDDRRVGALPEPGTLALLSLGLIGLIGSRRKRT